MVNILIVDDRKENLLALEAVLDEPNYRLISATSGEEALKHILKTDFAVILLDVQMPGIDGFETAKLIRAREKSQGIPIIFLTALSQTKEHVMNGYAVGAIDYIFKPFPPLVLKSKVEGFVRLYLGQKKIEEQNMVILEKNDELQKSEALARAITDTSIDALITVDKYGKILSVNPSGVRKFGYTKQELLDESITKLLPVFEEQTLQEVEKKSLIESKGIRKNQNVFPIEFQISMTSIDQGSFYVCSIRDITEKKYKFDQLEELIKERSQALYESEEKYRNLVEGSPEAIIIQQVDSGEWTFINEKGLQLLGASTKDEVLGDSFTKFIHNKDYRLVKKNMEIAKTGNKSEIFEACVKRIDGEVINVQIKCIPFAYLGIPSLHIVMRDITELKQSREFIKQSEKLTVVGELAAGIAHEIRNPLTSLRGFTQLFGLNEGSNNEYIPIMLEEIDRINTIVSELLLLAKPNEVEFTQIELEKLLETIMILMSSQANLHGVEIDLRVDARLKNRCYIFGLENKVKQVFINIVKNAIEAMPDGGILTIKIGQKNDHLSIQFIDQGCGIPREYLEKIGNPFFTTKDTGTGLGIMVCQNIIENHQGLFEIESEVGIGTAVKISLPMFEKEEDEGVYTS